MNYTAKSYLDHGNRTRGEYGVKPQLERVSWDPETNGWVPDDDGNSWGAWDPDCGWIAPWPAEDVIADTDDA